MRGKKHGKEFGQSVSGHIADEELVRLLKAEPQKGMILLMEQYTGIIWKIVSRHLENPEDIKECVNETFTRFYFQREKYDPGRAPLVVYLSVIASRTAISRYRREKHRSVTVPGNETALEKAAEGSDPENRISRAELRADLEQAMEELRPDEVQIIRMKYYDGMTIREIADTLNLPYETVKKRHHRSISRMRRTLLLTLIILILLLLTACTYKVLRYYEIVPELPEIWRILTGGGSDEDDVTGGVKPLVIPDSPGWQKHPEAGTDSEEDGDAEEEPALSGGEANNVTAAPEDDGQGASPDFSEIRWVEDYGVITSPDQVVYTLQEPVVTESEYTTTTLESVTYDGDWLITQMEVQVKTEAVTAAGIEINLEQGYSTICPRFETLSCGGRSWQAVWYRAPEDWHAETMTLLSAFSPEDLLASGNEPLEMTLHSKRTFNDSVVSPEGEELSFTMFPGGEGEQEEYVCAIDEEHILALRPRLEDGHLIVSVNPATISGDNLLSASLVYGSAAYMYGGEDGGTLTVTGEDGEARTGRCLLWSPFSTRQYFDWDFGEAAPGTYTLSIPYYIYKRTMPEDFTLPIDFENYIWSDEAAAIPGGTISVESVTPIEVEPGSPVTDSDGFPVIVSASDCPNARYWRLKLRVTSDDPAFPIGLVCMTLKADYKGYTDYCMGRLEFKTSSQVVDYGDQTALEIAAAGKRGMIDGPVTGTMEFIVSCCTASWDPSTFRLGFESRSGPDHVNYCESAGMEVSFTVH